MQAICITCVEFINMMAGINRLPEAALLLGHLDKTAPYWAPEVAEARSMIAAAAADAPTWDQPSLDDTRRSNTCGSVLRQLRTTARRPRHVLRRGNWLRTAP